MVSGLAGGGEGVSPELTLRPSLSVPLPNPIVETADRVSPELTLRPSLSAVGLGELQPAIPGVAGANAPAFVERARTSTSVSGRVCVAGANAPAFVERGYRGVCSTASFSCRRGAVA